ncbi:hypothetical protein OS493_034306 [Desmophyllum pertusum]|uniref:Steroid 21-hydroxylase n=1 Tax=Desmophyllum pertusum TaxID=174260 RepID=A0A9X0CNQ5_9CNID|nr:hypothetical protein OS493_034306 [Desmophyllum pertusum]
MIAEVVALLIFLVAVYVVSTIWENRNLPPGPFPLPMLGNLLSVGLKQPYRDLANMAEKYGKLFRIHMGSRKVIVINSYEIAREALIAKAEDFAGRPHHFFGSIFGRNSTDLAFQTFSQRWKIQHKITLTALRLTADKANIALHVEQLCEKFHSYNGKPFCPRDLVYKSFGNCLSSLIFGQENKLDDCEVDKLIEALHIFAKSLGAANFIDTFPIFKYFPIEIIRKARQAAETRDEIFERKFEEHVSTFQKDNIRDLIDTMLKGFHENNARGLLTEEYLISSASDVFMPGTETPSTVMTWLVFYAIKYPDVQARLHRELDDVIGNTNRLPEISDRHNLPYLEAFIAEVHRIVSDTPLAVPHSTMRDTSLAGFLIPRDTTVFLNLWAIHHNPDYWNDPFCFKPERFLDEQGQLHVEGILPFSLGKRSCPGESFGKKAVFLYVARLLYRFKFECPPGDMLPGEEECDYGILLDCKPFKMCAIARRNEKR